MSTILTALYFAWAGAVCAFLVAMDISPWAITGAAVLLSVVWAVVVGGAW